MKKTLLFALGLVVSLITHSQVGIGTNTVSSSAKLQIDASSSTDAKGFLPPRVSLTAINNNSPFSAAPATGILVYNIATAGTAPNNVTPGFYYYDGVRWQRVLNTQDATVTFNGTDPSAGGTVFTGGPAASSNYIYVSDDNNSQWTWNGTSYVTYVPPASTPWYKSTGTNDAGSDKTGKIYRTGNVGIGTTDPGNKLEIKAATSNASGLKFTNLTSSSPTSSGATLGVDASGNVVTVTGSSFTPESGSGVLGTTTTVTSGNHATLASITMSNTGTYLIVYSMRAQGESAVAGQFATGYLTTTTSSTTPIENTEILGAFPGNGTAGAPGGTFTGTHILTVSSAPTTIFFRAKASVSSMIFYNDANGRTKISYVKITP